jgi:uncharacterized protein YwgA
MNYQKRTAILLSLIEHLRQLQSWCGETHVQKGTYFLQTLMGVPLEYEFILYKYGPYSFELSDELASMRADSLIRLSLNPPYGPSLVPGEAAGQVKNQFPRTLEQFERQIDFVANKLGDKQVSELEALSTALYVRVREDKDIPEDRHVQLLRESKPHMALELARNAVDELITVIQESQNLQAAA